MTVALNIILCPMSAEEESIFTHLTIYFILAGLCMCVGRYVCTHKCIYVRMC